MSRRLTIAALALAAVVGASPAGAAETKPAKGGGVTTLPDSSGGPAGWQWPGSDDATSSFTSLAVVKDGALTQSLDSAQNASAETPGAALQAGAATVATDPARPAPAAPKTLRERISHLPEPGIWALMLIGVAMIGFAIRGLVAANRRLARLEAPEKLES